MTLDPAELEQRVDRALKQLPRPAAPTALLMKVMRGVEAVETVATEWPAALKIGLSAIGAAIVIVAFLAWPLALEYARTAWCSPAVVLLRTAVATIRPMVPAALMYVTAMCVVAAGAASMLKHVALGGATNS